LADVTFQNVMKVRQLVTTHSMSHIFENPIENVLNFAEMWLIRTCENHCDSVKRNYGQTWQANGHDIMITHTLDNQMVTKIVWHGQALRPNEN
jgi:hypothetical protein